MTLELPFGERTGATSKGQAHQSTQYGNVEVQNEHNRHQMDSGQDGERD